MKKQYKYKQLGLSLIELLVSMLIGGIILIGVIQAFASVKTSSKVLQAEAVIQENARFAFSAITSIIQEAGNFGCQTANTLSTNSSVNTADETFRPSRVIEGWEAVGTSFGDTYIASVDSEVVNVTSSQWVTSGDAEKDLGTFSKESSDVLKVWYTKKERGQLASIAGNVLTFSAVDIENGDILVVNDCQSLLFTQVCSCEDGDCADTDTEANIDPTACNAPGNNAINLSNINIPTTEVSVLESALFFIGKRDDDSSNTPALFVRHLGSDAKLDVKEEILEGVESLQILYGEDTNGDKSPNYYVSANAVTNWNSVVSLKISLLLRSYKNNIFSSAQSLEYNGSDIYTSTSDRYLRRVFTSTISLRNRNVGY